MDASDQAAIDRRMIELDGTPNKGKLGANAILGVSLAAAQRPPRRWACRFTGTWAASRPATLPVPMMNILNGGAHADNNVDIQEFMIMPVGAESFAEGAAHGRGSVSSFESGAAGEGAEHRRGGRRRLRPEPAVQPGGPGRHHAGHRAAGYRPGEDIVLALDVAATELFEDGRYKLAGEGVEYDTDGMIGFYKDLVGAYPIVSIEDPLSEDDWDAWAGSDRGARATRCSWWATTCSSPIRSAWRGASSERTANSILVKVNQIGTLTETLRGGGAWPTRRATPRSCRTARARPRTPPSRIWPWRSTRGRSRPARPAVRDRVAKYNQLLRIEEELGAAARYPGRSIFARLKWAGRFEARAGGLSAGRSAVWPARRVFAFGRRPPPAGAVKRWPRLCIRTGVC